MKEKIISQRADIMSSRIGMTIEDKLVLSTMLSLHYVTGGTIETSEEYFSRKFGWDNDTSKRTIDHLYEGGVIEKVEYSGVNSKGEKTYRYKLFWGLNSLFPGCLDY